MAGPTKGWYIPKDQATVLLRQGRLHRDIRAIFSEKHNQVPDQGLARYTLAVLLLGNADPVFQCGQRLGEDWQLRLETTHGITHRILRWRY